MRMTKVECGRARQTPGGGELPLPRRRMFLNLRALIHVLGAGVMARLCLGLGWMNQPDAR